MAPSRQRQVEIPTWRSKSAVNQMEFPVPLIIPSVHEMEWMRPGQWLGARLIILGMDHTLVERKWPKGRHGERNRPRTDLDEIEDQIFNSTSISSIVEALTECNMEAVKSMITKRNKLARRFNEFVQTGICSNGPCTQPEKHSVPVLRDFLNTTAQLAPNMAPSKGNVANDHGSGEKTRRNLTTFHVNGIPVFRMDATGISGPVDITLAPEIRAREGASEAALQGLYTEEWLTLPAPHNHSIESSTLSSGGGIQGIHVDFLAALRLAVFARSIFAAGTSSAGKDGITGITDDFTRAQESGYVPRRFGAKSKSQRPLRTTPRDERLLRITQLHDFLEHFKSYDRGQLVLRAARALANGELLSHHLSIMEGEVTSPRRMQEPGTRFTTGGQAIIEAED